MTREETKILNEALFEKLASRDPVLEKQAVDAVNDFTRTKMREDGCFRRIMPPVPVSDDDLTHVVHTDKEPDSPAAISILPQILHTRGDRYEVTFDRIVTPRFTKNVLESIQNDLSAPFTSHVIRQPIVVGEPLEMVFQVEFVFTVTCCFELHAGHFRLSRISTGR